MTSNRVKASTYELEGMMELSDYEFQLFQELIHKNFGIYLSDAKRSLLVRRLQQYMRQNGFTSFKSYYDKLIQNPDDTSFTELANRITTNYTFFNREPDHFTYYTKTVLPEMVRYHQQRNSRDLRVWCAAASTGEEPYMLTMLMMDFFGGNYPLWNGGILATDISKKALEKASLGVYTSDQIQTLPKKFTNTYFDKIDGNSYRAKERLRKEITYRCFNLINKQYPFKKSFDVIFCRNVMIYFDNETKEFVLDKLYRSLRPGGYLFIGHSESVSRYDCPFKYVRPAVYKRVN